MSNYRTDGSKHKRSSLYQGHLSVVVCMCFTVLMELSFTELTYLGDGHTSYSHCGTLGVS